MLNAHIQDIVDVCIVKGIKNGFAVSACFDDFIGLQNAELMGNGCLGKPQKACDIADAKLTLVKRIENADACGISENFEKLRKIIEGILLRHRLAYLADGILVDAEKFTFFDIVGFVHKSASFSAEHMNICSYVIMEYGFCQ